MYLKQLKLKNFRGFEALDLTFDERLTVLVGRNGSGKSSVLLAIAGAAAQLTSEIFRRSQERPPVFVAADIRSGSSDAEVSTLWNPELEHRVGIGEDGARTLTPADKLPQHPPLCIAYNTDRTRTAPDLPRGSHARLSIATPHPAWDDELNSGYLPFELLRNWFRGREDFENQERVQKGNLKLVDPALDAVRRAATAILGPDFGAPRIERAIGVGAIVIKKGDATLTADQLSDGERTLLVIASNLARRLFLADPDAQDALQTEALVLIDEVELHLHPEWQRNILARLTATFPNVQFVVSTHSPIVLSEVNARSVRILEDFRAYNINDHVYGRDVNALLRDILGGTERPANVEAFIREISKLLDTNELEQAKRKTDQLEKIVGPHDSEVIRVRTMIDFLDRPLDRSEDS